jgi:transcriptional regulator with XRE-family HTH domain
MSFKEKYNINPEFEDLFSFNSQEEEIEHEAKMIMFRFLSVFEKLNENKPIKKKDLAKAIETSPSYITQLYQGSKLINLITLAKIQEAYDMTFEITAKPNNEDYASIAKRSHLINFPLLKRNCNTYAMLFAKNGDLYTQNKTLFSKQKSKAAV